MIDYKIGVEKVQWDQLFNLYKEAGLLKRFIENREYEKVRRAFNNSYKVVTAWDGDKLIGAARMISDGICYASIYDVAVLPEYQKRGIGKGIMNKIMKGEEHMPMALTSTFGNEEFYRKLGFKRHKTAHTKYPFKSIYVED